MQMILRAKRQKEGWEERDRTEVRCPLAAAPFTPSTPPAPPAAPRVCGEVCGGVCARVCENGGPDGSEEGEQERREREREAPAECLRRSPAASAPPACLLTALSPSLRLSARARRTFAVMGSAGHHDAAPAAPAAPAIAPNLPTQRAALPAATAAGLIYLGATSGERSLPPC